MRFFGFSCAVMRIAFVCTAFDFYRNFIEQVAGLRRFLNAHVRIGTEQESH